MSLTLLNEKGAAGQQSLFYAATMVSQQLDAEKTIAC